MTPQNKSNPSILSFIIDGMDQAKCQVPYKGTQDSFSDPFKQVITGVKEHGHGVTLFPTIDTVTKGANLTLYCILSIIEGWKHRNGYYPTEIFIQLDGAKDNANKYVLGMLELLVVKRMAQIIYFTRLPVGHTHDDIDACFGIMWKYRGRFDLCETFSEFRDHVKRAFKCENMEVDVKEPVLLIPNFADFLDKYIGRLERLHILLQTQHQWRFEAIDRSPYFPFGCKTTFRAYSSQKVVEFEKKPPDLCVSDIGRYTGLEPITTYCRWYPTDRCNPNRPVEGMHILNIAQGIPHTDDTSIPPVNFPEGSYLSIKTTLNEIKATYLEFGNPKDDIIRKEWIDWEEKYAPQSDNSVDYLRALRAKGLPYHIPLKSLLLDKDEMIRDTRWKISINQNSFIDTKFEWPINSCIATNSVATEFNPHPPPPRQHFAIQDEEIARLRAFEDTTRGYYFTVLQQFNVEALKSLLKACKADFTGSQVQMPGIYYHV